MDASGGENCRGIPCLDWENGYLGAGMDKYPDKHDVVVVVMGGSEGAA